MKDGRTALLLAIATLLFFTEFCEAAVRGRVLLVDAASRTKPGNLILGRIAGDERNFETLVEGDVVDAHFSPDGKSIVYGIDGKILTMDLATGKSQEVGQFTAEFTYFYWCNDNKVYFADGKDVDQIVSVDIASKERNVVHKGYRGRAHVSADGKKAAWVLPPVCAHIGGKAFRIVGGCGGAVSPSGNYVTSNLTTSHRLIGIFTFDETGPSAKPIVTVPGPRNYAINGFSFGRSDDWVCYTVEAPANVAPLSYICYWRTGDHILVGKYVIKDFFDETDALPDDAVLERITVCLEGPTNTPIEHEFVNVRGTTPLKVVGHFKGKGGEYTPQLRDGITWKTDGGKVDMSHSACTGVAEAEMVTVTADYKGKSYSLKVTVLPALTGDGFKAEYFSDGEFSKLALARVEPYIDWRWEGNASPDASIDGRKPWSVRWTGTIDVQIDGDYTFYFLQGEGNDRWSTGPDKEKKSAYGVWVDGKLVISLTKSWNYPWDKPKPSEPIALKKGRHSVMVTTVDASSQPVVTQLLWSGPGMRQRLLGGVHVHSNDTAAAARPLEHNGDK